VAAVFFEQVQADRSESPLYAARFGDYQGECPLCEDALIDPANKYQQLEEQNVRVIAISADKIEQGFEKKPACHQWPDNYKYLREKNDCCLSKRK
jgi:hypothetical protein